MLNHLIQSVVFIFIISCVHQVSILGTGNVIITPIQDNFNSFYQKDAVYIVDKRKKLKTKINIKYSAYVSKYHNNKLFVLAYENLRLDHKKFLVIIS